MTVDMVNYLVINNVNCNILYNFSSGYDEILLFNPIQTNNVSKYKFKKIVSTIYSSTYFAKEISNKYDVPLVYFAQGYEPYFDNGKDYGIVELSYKLADSILTISDYLKIQYKNTFFVPSTVVRNGINYDLLYNENNNSKIKTITFVLRNNVLKGDFILLDILKNITNRYKNLNINLLYNDENFVFPFNYNDTIKINYHKGPFTRKELANIFQKSDLYIDASFTEGFGLVPLEAMAAGNVVVVSNSGGVNDYLEDGINGFVIDNVNDANGYIEKIDLLLNDEKVYQNFKVI